MYNIGSDIRYGLRRLLGAPAFTLFSIITLAIGIGAVTAICSAVDALVFSSRNIPGIDRLMNVYQSQPPAFNSSMVQLSWPDYLDLRAQQTQFARITAWARFRQALSWNGVTEPTMAEIVGGDYFAVVEARPELGRLLQPPDDQPGAPAVCVISDTYWRRRFGAIPAIIGTQVRIADQIVEIVGVVAPDYKGADLPSIMPTPMWLPIALGFRIDSNLAKSSLEREDRDVMVKGRLKPDGTVQAAKAEIAAIGSRLDAAVPIGRDIEPRFQQPYKVSRKWFAMPAADIHVHESADVVVVPLAIAVVAATGLVLLVACTNLANLTLARSSRRKHEIAVRMALGASRRELIRGQLVEGAMIAATGGALGVGVARFLMIGLSQPVRVESFLLQLSPTFDMPVVLAAGAATLLTLFVFSFLPAVSFTRSGLSAALNSDGPTVSMRWSGGRGMISAQVMVSTILVMLAFLCVQQVRALSRQDFGIDLAHLAAAKIDFKMSRYSETSARLLMAEALRSARARLGGENVAIASGLPLEQGAQHAYLGVDGVVPGSPGGGFAAYVSGTPEMFSVFGIDLMHGRIFDDRDSSNEPPIGIVSEAIGRKMFGSVDVVGRQMQVLRQQWAGDPEQPVETITIVGVVRDPNRKALGLENGSVFRPWDQAYDPTVSLVARTAGDPLTLLDPLRRTISSLDSNAAIIDVSTAATIMGIDGTLPKIMGGMAGLLGSFAMILSLVGLYGILVQLVAARTREIGLRLALGADPKRIIRMILREGLRPVVSGLIAGLIIATALRVTMQRIMAQLFPELDPVAIALVPVLFLSAALLACWLPARRASRVDPMVALREL